MNILLTIEPIEATVYFLGGLICLFILHWVIASAVKQANKPLRDEVKKQNYLLMKLLNQQGVSKDEIMDLFVEQKADVLQSLKNSNTIK